MKYLQKANLVLLILLSISTGAVKLAQMEAEMTIFRQAAFPDWLTILFGVLQLVGGLCLLATLTRTVASLIMAGSFAVATGVLFVNGMIPFGLFSLLFIVMALWQYQNKTTLVNESI